MCGFKCTPTHGEKRISIRISKRAPHQLNDVTGEWDLTTWKLSDAYLLQGLGRYFVKRNDPMRLSLPDALL